MVTILKIGTISSLKEVKIMIKLICEVCGKEYEIQPHKVNKSKFCSRKCFDQKSYQRSLNEQEKQIILNGIFGDGNLKKYSGKYHKYYTSSIHKEYILFKQSFLKNLNFGAASETLNKGYKIGNIYQFSTQSHPEISKIAEQSLEESLKMLDELGAALWFFDDGSYHKKKKFYNLNSHKFSYDFQNDVLIPTFKNLLDINGTISYDRKKDGRVFTYLRFNKINGNAKNISDLLKKYDLKYFHYKHD
jgi:hypothetical protein